MFFNLDLSPDERRVAVSQMTQQHGAKAQFDIWLIDLARSGAATLLTDDPAYEFDPTWSPDGERVAFNSNRPEPGRSAYSLFTRASNSSGKDETLVTSEQSIVAPDWSRDGRFVVYSRDASGTGSDLWTVRINGEPNPQVLLATRHDEASATFSPDGRWIAYQSNSSGRSEVYVLPFPVRGGPVPVSRDGGWSPRWRGDGREIFFAVARRLHDERWHRHDEWLHGDGSHAALHDRPEAWQQSPVRCDEEWPALLDSSTSARHTYHGRLGLAGQARSLIWSGNGAKLARSLLEFVPRGAGAGARRAPGRGSR